MIGFFGLMSFMLMEFEDEDTKLVYITLFFFITLIPGVENLVILYFYIEIITFLIFLVFILVGPNTATLEATIKYFFISALSSVFLLIGIITIFFLLESDDYSVIISQNQTFLNEFTYVI